MAQRSARPLWNRNDVFQYDYPIAALVVGICTTLAVILRSRVAITNIAMLYLLGAIVISIKCRRSVAIASAIVGIACFYYFSVPHWNSFVIEDYNYVVILITTLTVSLVITTLTIKIRAQAEHATERETRTRSMYQLIEELSGENSEEGAARIAARTIEEIFDAEVAVYLTDDQYRVTRRIEMPETFSAMTDDERAFAQTIMESDQRSSTLFRDEQQVRVRYGIPLMCAGTVVAAMTLIPSDRNRLNEPEQMRFLEAMCSQIAAAIERLRSSNSVRKAEAEIQAERMRNALLNAVSHDIKTPLASIYGAATSLLEQESRLGAAARRICWRASRTNPSVSTVS
jgi:two-component system sensor histidine kinase KdpD